LRGFPGTGRARIPDQGPCPETRNALPGFPIKDVVRNSGQVVCLRSVYGSVYGLAFPSSLCAVRAGLGGRTEASAYATNLLNTKAKPIAITALALSMTSRMLRRARQANPRRMPPSKSVPAQELQENAEGNANWRSGSKLPSLGGKINQVAHTRS
jgi:hypothetical protein